MAEGFGVAASQVACQVFEMFLLLTPMLIILIQTGCNHKFMNIRPLGFVKYTYIAINNIAIEFNVKSIRATRNAPAPALRQPMPNHDTARHTVAACYRTGPSEAR